MRNNDLRCNAGQCSCRTLVVGRRCERCINTFYGLLLDDRKGQCKRMAKIIHKTRNKIYYIYLVIREYNRFACYLTVIIGHFLNFTIVVKGMGCSVIFNLGFINFTTVVKGLVKITLYVGSQKMPSVLLKPPTLFTTTPNIIIAYYQDANHLPPC